MPIPALEDVSTAGTNLFAKKLFIIVPGGCYNILKYMKLPFTLLYFAFYRQKQNCYLPFSMQSDNFKSLAESGAGVFLELNKISSLQTLSLRSSDMCSSQILLVLPIPHSKLFV